MYAAAAAAATDARQATVWQLPQSSQVRTAGRTQKGASEFKISAGSFAGAGSDLTAPLSR